jgi:hypothetical protein
MLVASTNKQVKAKRQRVLTIHTTSVEFRIKKLQKELGLTDAEAKWQSICNEVKRLQEKGELA